MSATDASAPASTVKPNGDQVSAEQMTSRD